MTQVDKIDGRRARGLRTRDAIVAALQQLVAGGEVAPTAQRIAERAGVSVRSVYQHFDDVEGLYADAADRTYRWVAEVSSAVDPALPLARRVEIFVDNRSTVLETLVPFTRAARLVEPGSERMSASRVALEKADKDRIGRIFAPELKAMDAPRRSAALHAIDAISSAESWDHLRRNGQSLRAARQVLRAVITALLAS